MEDHVILVANSIFFKAGISMPVTTGGGTCYWIVRSGSNGPCSTICSSMTSFPGNQGVPSGTTSLFYQCYPNTGTTTQFMNGITFSTDGLTLDASIMNIANYVSTANCSSSYSCNPITSTLAANNLLRYVTTSYAATELLSEPVICGYGYKWADSTSGPKSAVCAYPGNSNWILPSTACVCMLIDVIICLKII